MEKILTKKFLSSICLFRQKISSRMKNHTSAYLWLAVTCTLILSCTYITFVCIAVKSINVNGRIQNCVKTSDYPIQDKSSTHKKIKKILFWTSYFNWKDFQFGIGQEPFLHARCPVTDCMTTNDRELLNESDVLIFHPINYDSVNDAPRHRMSQQRYVFLFYEAEASGRMYSVFQPPTQKGFFNWTMTYRRDSDIYSPYPYGILRRKNSSSIDNLPVPLDSGLLPKEPATFLRNIMNKNLQASSKDTSFGNKTKKVAWFVSKCRTMGRREIFFRQLFNFFPFIDVYGECGSKGLDCLPWNSLQCDKILSDYKFYIAAENSLCPDYITEKFYRALQFGAIPIVYGGADYSAYAPPNSFIHAADFQSPKALAHYLSLLDENPNLYARYFEWRKEWLVDRKPFDGWCALCKKLNEPVNSQVSKSYEDIGKWWFDDVPCVQGSSVKDYSWHT